MDNTRIPGHIPGPTRHALVAIGKDHVAEVILTEEALEALNSGATAAG